MTIKVAINGFGRIGRNVLRALYENKAKYPIQIVGINDMASIDTVAYLLKYDSTFGIFEGDVRVENNALIVNGDKIHYSSEPKPSLLPWKTLGVDTVFECTGRFTAKDKACDHLSAGAKKVIISAPGEEVDATVVYGVNHQTLKSTDTVISNASCTTNCLAPLAKPLHDAFGIVKGLMVTIHAYTNDQALQDAPHKDLRRGRAAALSMIPTKTGAASAVGLVIPELDGKLDGYAMRVPVSNVSVVDFTFETKKPVSAAEVNQVLKKASESTLKNILIYNTDPLVSIDFNKNPASSIFDATQTRVIDNMVKVVSWYDNEWGFSNRMLDVATYWK